MPTSPISRARHAQGFTLLELMVVIALAMIALTVFSLSIGGPNDDRRVSIAARQIANSLNYAQSLTARRGQSVDFMIDPAKREFWIEDLTRPVLVREGVALSVTSAREVQGDNDTPTIRFMPDGSATGGQIVLTAGAAARDINIDWLTGLVSIAP